MREMIDSGIEWVGMIPSTWDTISNKYIMRKQKRICSTWNGEDVLSLTVNGVIVRDLENPTGKMPATFDGYQYAYENELLMCLFDIDVTPRCVGRVRNNGVTSPAYSCFVLNDGYDVNYFYYYYLMVDHTKELLHLAKNLRHSFTEEQLGVLQVPVPSAEEQHKIAGFLDRECGEIDSVLARTRASVDEYKRLKQSLVSQIVLSGIRGNRELKECGIDWVGQIPKDWKVLKNSFLFRENVRPPREDSISLSLSQVDGLVATTDMKESALQTSTYEGWKRVEIGDLVLNRFKAHLGVMFAATLEGMVSFHYGVYEPQMELNTKYYEYLCHSDAYKAIYANKSNGMVVGLQNLSNQNFYSVRSVYPPIDEQIEIATYLDQKCAEIDELIRKKEELITYLETYKKSLIYEYVTGKKEVQ